MHTSDMSAEYRDLLTRLFLPENMDCRSGCSQEKLESMAKLLLGTETPESSYRSRFAKTPEEDPEAYLFDKMREFRSVYYRYTRIYAFCQTLGISHIFDIGCQGINQAFLLVENSRVSYVGMDSSFSLNDLRKEDRETGKTSLPLTRNAPPPFCHGRIRFVKGYYPDTPLEVPPDSIAVGCYSFTMTRGKEAIHRLADALTRDFDRLLFNVPFADFPEPQETLRHWKNAPCWNGYTIRPIGSCGFVYATRHPEDLHLLEKIYPCDSRGWFRTGIDDGNDHFGTFVSSPEPYLWYADWVQG